MNYDQWKTTEPEMKNTCKNCLGYKENSIKFCSKECEEEYYS